MPQSIKTTAQGRKRPPLFELMNAILRKGHLQVIDWQGSEHHFGNTDEQPVIIRLPDPAVQWQLLRHPRLGIGEAYMDGRIELLEGDLFDFLSLLARNRSTLRKHSKTARWLHIGRFFMRGLATYNPPDRAKDNATHYELEEPFFKLFLDQHLQYSCGYYRSVNDDLETAQINKMKYLAGKLMLDEAGLKVLDIGCGWGGLSRFFTQQYGAHVDGITLSQGQLDTCLREQSAHGLQGQTGYALKDYRQVEGTYDRIASIEMFEHVGTRQFVEYFQQIRRLLNRRGVCVLQFSGRMSKPGATDPWLNKYIFPGGYTPSLSETIAAIEMAGLWVSDVEVWRLHYVHTLRDWFANIHRNKAEIIAMYDERFFRMWEFYLAICRVAFNAVGQTVFQLQITRSRRTVPQTRNYIDA